MSRLAEQYLTEAELNRIKGLVHYLNENLMDATGTDAGSAAADVALTDTNGEHLGDIKYNRDAKAYAFVYIVEEPSDAPTA